MRRFNAYETNFLLNYGFDPKEVSSKAPDDIPVEYVVGIAPFYENEFYVNSSTLIPRIETEYLIELALQFTLNSKKNCIRFADIGTGSGAIGITFALELLKRNIHFEGTLSDNSAKAIKVAEKNLKTYKKIISSKFDLHIIQSDLFKNYNSQKPLDLIFANLPYIPSNRIPKLPVSVKGYEPINALDGGEDGLNIIRKLLKDAGKFLKVDGVVLLEVDDSHTAKLTKEFSEQWNIEIKNDLNGKNRFWVCELIKSN